MLAPILQSNQTLLEVPHSQLPAIMGQLEAEGYFVAEVDRAPVYNKETLMHALYQSCRFPGYFGFNWDALADCLTDFSWAEARGYFLVFRNWSLLRTEAPEEARLLQEVVADAAQVWAIEGRTLRVLAGV